MDTYITAIEYINKQEATDISYVRVGDASCNLVVSFSSNGHTGFERKKTLTSEKYESNLNFDILYIRNQLGWYLGEMKGIGSDFYDTLEFLKDQISLYENVIFTGLSAGGYASILYGSKLSIPNIVVSGAQTDLDYCIKNLKKHPSIKYLNYVKDNYSHIFSRYANLQGVINSKCKYFVYYPSDEELVQGGESDEKTNNYVFHNHYHYDVIKNFNTVNKLKKWEDMLPKILDSIK
jgi:hypothetical protein